MRAKPTLAFCGKSGWLSSSGPRPGRAASGTSKSTTCGLPMETAVTRTEVAPACSDASIVGASRSTGTSAGSRLAARIATRTCARVSSRASTVVGWGPASVSRSTLRPTSRRPVRARCKATQRRPLPHISARLPSALSTRMAKRSSARSTKSTPSAPTPRCRSHIAMTSFAVSAAGGRSITTKSLPRPSYFSNAIRRIGALSPAGRPSATHPRHGCRGGRPRARMGA